MAGSPAATVQVDHRGNPTRGNLAIAYGLIEKDAMFGQFVDSDFAGGTTDAKGDVLRAMAVVAAAGWYPERHYFMNQRSIDLAGRDPARLRPLPDRPELEVLRRAVARL